MRSTLAILLLALAGACREDNVVPRPRVAGGDPGRGPALIVAHGCGSCHQIPGVPMARGRVGPSLAALADRSYLAGRLTNTADNLVAWIVAPDSVQPGTAMPDLGVSERDARDIGAYLYTLAGDRLGPPHPIPQRVLPVH